MTLRGILTAQLPLQARWTCEARLARSFAASVLARIPLADLLVPARALSTPFGRLAGVASLSSRGCARLMADGAPRVPARSLLFACPFCGLGAAAGWGGRCFVIIGTLIKQYSYRAQFLKVRSSYYGVVVWTF